MSTVGAGGCLAVGSNMIRGGEMAEDFYYVREQRRGNVQVGAALVLMGALYLAEGALRWEIMQRNDPLLEEAEATDDDHAGRANRML